MLNNIDAVIFDLDGTLVDSMWMWKQIDIEYLSRYHIELPEKLQFEIEGMSFSETALYFKEKFNLSDSLEKIKSDWNTMAFEKYKKEVPFKKGAIDFLHYLKEKRIKTGIATSNSKDLVNAVINSHGVCHLFDSIHTSCEVKKGKPAPDIYNLVAKDLETEPEQCLVFEDVIQGIMAGKNAGMKVCAVYDDFTSACDQEKRALADYYISDFYEMF
ncbi:MAG: HAD family phosphatase [Acetivibrio sp.]